jgi:hypothetical protein
MTNATAAVGSAKPATSAGSDRANGTANASASARPAIAQPMATRRYNPLIEARSATVSATQHKHLTEALAIPPQVRQTTSAVDRRTITQGTSEARNPTTLHDMP